MIGSTINFRIIFCRAIRTLRNCCNNQDLMGRLFEAYSRISPHSFQNYEREHFWIYRVLPNRRDGISSIYWRFNSSWIVPSMRLVLWNVVYFMKKLGVRLCRWQLSCWWFGMALLSFPISLFYGRLAILLVDFPPCLAIFPLLKVIWCCWLHFYGRFGLAFIMRVFRDFIWIEIHISSLIIIKSSIGSPDSSMCQSQRTYSLSLWALLSMLIFELKCGYFCAKVLNSLIRKPFRFRKWKGGLGWRLIEDMLDILRISMSVVIHQYFNSWKLIDLLCSSQRKVQNHLTLILLSFSMILALQSAITFVSVHQKQEISSSDWY